MGPEYEDEDEERQVEREEQEDWERLQADPYTDDEKDQMGSSEFFSDND